MSKIYINLLALNTVGIFRSGIDPSAPTHTHTNTHPHTHSPPHTCRNYLVAHIVDKSKSTRMLGVKHADDSPAPA